LCGRWTRGSPDGGGMLSMPFIVALLVAAVAYMAWEVVHCGR
jgi:hypothetical protein